MIASSGLSQEIFATDMLTALKSSLEHSCKHVLPLLRLYRDQTSSEVICMAKEGEIKLTY